MGRSPSQSDPPRSPSLSEGELEPVPGFDKALGHAVPRWVAEGIITEDQARAILARTAAGETGSAGRGADWLSSLLYGTAGVLLGAAALSLILVGIDPAEPRGWLVATGVLLVGAGLLLVRIVRARRFLGEAVLAAALVPLSAAGVGDPGALLPLSAAFGIGVPLGYLVWERSQPFLPVLSVIAFSFAAGAHSLHLAREAGWGSGTGSFVWAGSALALAMIALALDRRRGEGEGVAHVALSVIALGIALVVMFGEGLDLSDSVTMELLLGGMMAIVLLAGVVLRHRGLVLGASIVLGVDAIVFAFDVGGVWLGVGVLVTLAALMVWQAESLKQWIPGRV